MFIRFQSGPALREDRVKGEGIYFDIFPWIG